MFNVLVLHVNSTPRAKTAVIICSVGGMQHWVSDGPAEFASEIMCEAMDLFLAMPYQATPERIRPALWSQ